jgi:hypothetical protein
MRKRVGQATTAERENKRNKKKCRMSSDIGAEQENHNVGRGPTLDRKGLKQDGYHVTLSHEKVSRYNFRNDLLGTPDQGHSPEL